MSRITATTANALGIFSPAITLALFALGRALDAETAFTTTAILGMVTHPANMVMTIVPRAVAALAGFERIQAYLLQPRRLDERQDTKPVGVAVRMQGVSVGSVLKSVSMEVQHGSLVVVSGPVGSGKSMLLRALLGEVHPARGSIQLASRLVAYCAQTPWLPNGSIKQAIRGLGEGGGQDSNNMLWYRRVVETCCLRHDLDLLPDGDETQIGSAGLNLSGGQRQRVVSVVNPEMGAGANDMTQLTNLGTGARLVCQMRRCPPG